jgi:hypothetical protein
MLPKPKHEPVAEEDLEMRPVPVSDYALHFGKPARLTSVNWPDDGTSVTESVADHRGTSATGVDIRSSCKHSS